MKVHLYCSPNGRVVAVDNCRKARERLPVFGPPTPMFEGRPVTYSVAKACIRNFGGLWYRADGIRRFRGIATEARSTGTHGA
ncbi:hypothetical protein [uncultured Abyssibacter sp.]|uniref:hypothetical protein n=1 Tax=uncultured Abyssibacter sp. TaxID=2320202 RepID=UPI0032B15BFF